jgi:transposase
MVIPSASGSVSTFNLVMPVERVKESGPVINAGQGLAPFLGETLTVEKCDEELRAMLFELRRRASASSCVVAGVNVMPNSMPWSDGNIPPSNRMQSCPSDIALTVGFMKVPILEKAAHRLDPLGSEFRSPRGFSAERRHQHEVIGMWDHLVVLRAEEKIRIVLEGLRGEESIAALCRREGIAESLYYNWSKEFLEAGKKRLGGDTARAATSDEVKVLRRETRDLKEVVAEQAPGTATAQKSMIADGGDGE